MNLSFHSSETYFSPERLPKEDPCHEKVTLAAWIVEHMKPTCLRRNKRKQMEKKEELTLKEWLLKLPMSEDSSEYYGFKHCSGSDPSVAEDCSLSLEQLLRSEDCYAPMSEDYSFSFEKLLKDEMVDEKDMEFSSLSSSQSSKMKKRVSFRSPKVSDIIVFHPSEVDFEE